jgi:hypothetical protein
VLERVEEAMPVRYVVVTVLAAMLGAAALSSAMAQGGAGPRVYQVGEITLDRYTVLERIWVESWRTFSVFDVPKRADEPGAIAALREEAARLGADGIVNLHCVNDGGGFLSRSGHFCYANAIKLK